MKKTWLIGFAVALITDLIAVYLKNEILVYVAKPLIVIALILYFLSATKGMQSGLIIIFIRALVFSWLGDFVLMFESFNKNIFLIGLLAFLFAHLIYIRFFSLVRMQEKIKLKPGLILLVVVYYSGLIFLLFNDLHELKIPVIVYGFIISTMFLLAIHMLFIKDKEAGKLMMLGAILFVASDSILAVNKFYQPFEYAGIVIMLTYGIAQLLITLGAVRYILPPQNNKFAIRFATEARRSDE
jgi:uncharacterized membrane protein YhhN